jgi:chromosome segregation ATPase
MKHVLLRKSILLALFCSSSVLAREQAWRKYCAPFVVGLGVPVGVVCYYRWSRDKCQRNDLAAANEKLATAQRELAAAQQRLQAMPDFLHVRSMFWAAKFSYRISMAKAKREDVALEAAKEALRKAKSGRETAEEQLKVSQRTLDEAKSLSERYRPSLEVAKSNVHAAQKKLDNASKNLSTVQTRLDAARSKRTVADLTWMSTNVRLKESESALTAAEDARNAAAQKLQGAEERLKSMQDASYKANKKANEAEEVRDVLNRQVKAAELKLSTETTRGEVLALDLKRLGSKKLHWPAELEADYQRIKAENQVFEKAKRNAGGRKKAAGS